MRLELQTTGKDVSCTRLRCVYLPHGCGGAISVSPRALFSHLFAETLSSRRAGPLQVRFHRGLGDWREA